MTFPERHNWSLHSERRRGYPDENRTDTQWIYEQYLDTDAYEKAYAYALDVIRTSGGNSNIEKYIGLGSGLGRQTVVAIKTFQSLSQVWTVDSDIPIHPSVRKLGVPIEEIRLPIYQALHTMIGKPEASSIDMIAIENCETHDLMATCAESIALLRNVLAPGGSFVTFGQVNSLLYADKFCKYSQSAPGFTTIDLRTVSIQGQHNYLKQLWIRSE